ncbi:helix-turn-helix transcriptional regulator [Roseibium sp. M-1]
MAVSAEKYIQLSNLAVSAAMDPQLWQPFLDDLGQALGTQVCTQLIGYDKLTGTAPLAFASGYEPAILDLYQGTYADKNPFAANFAQCPIGDVITTHQLCPPQTLKKTSFYADLLLPMEDITAGGGSMLAFDADRMFLIGGNMRARDRDRYEADWLRLCAQLAPVIRQSLEINRTISGLSFEKWAADQHLLGSGTSVFVIDGDLRIHYASDEGQGLLQQGTLVGCGFEERFEFRSQRVQSEFAAFTRFQSLGEHDIFRNWRLRDSHGKGWVCRSIGMRLSDLDKAPFGVFMTRPLSAVLLAIRPEPSGQSLQHQLQQEFGLSPAEAATALKLAGGDTPAEIALARGVSIHTVRNQIKASLSKTDCRRQSDLVRKVEHSRLRAGG